MRKITVKTSITLNIAQRKKLEDFLSARYADDEVTVSYVEEENLIGGIIVEDGETVYDVSVASTLFSFYNRSNDYITKMLSKGELPSMWKHEMLDLLSTEPNAVNYGKVVSCADGILTVEGLKGCRYYELLEIGTGGYAIAMNLTLTEVKAMLITANRGIEYGVTVKCTGKIVEVPVGETLLGRMVNPLGKPIDGREILHFDKTRPIESPAPAIIDRAKVSRPLQTGILAIDSMIPIGKGQRELIIGDRQTGKTSIAVDTIINQRDKDVICVYVAIGQRASAIGKLLEKLRQANAMKNTVIVAGTASDSAALQYIAPYTGCAIAEEFMAEGKDVLIVYDDLTKHANAYRTISLLLKRPSGREAYPGDVFYIHSRLLERSAQLSEKKGGGSITAIPIIETQAGDISQYIPTNVISITDGQIYLESELFHAGVRPAVNVGLSVSRVGGSAQFPAVRKFSGKLRLDLAHYREMELFMQFGAEVDESTKKILSNGEKITEILKQKEGDPMSVDREIVTLFLVNGNLDYVEKSEIKDYIDGFYHYLINSDYTLLKRMKSDGVLTEETEKEITERLKNYEVYYFNKKKYAKR